MKHAHTPGRPTALARSAAFAACVAVVVLLTACSILNRETSFDEPTLTETEARQAAADLATALDDLAARFLVADPATENLHVLRWEDDAESATARLSEQLGLVASASAFARATADELGRVAEHMASGGTAEPAADDDAPPPGTSKVSVVETRVTDVEPLGSDGHRADWLRVDIAQDQTYEDGQTSSSATSYGIAVREGSIVEVRDLPGLLTTSEAASAAPLARLFAEAVLAGDEAHIARHTSGTDVADRELATLRAWLAAAGSFEVAELPAAQAGSVQVAYLVPERGPLVRFEVAFGAGQRGAAQVSWEVLGGE